MPPTSTSLLLPLFILVLSVSFSRGHEHYQTALPNGNRVNHPCFPNKFWWGVGHVRQAGGGAQNQFGMDFKSAGRTWTRALCQKDSDGDGRTNGEEMGDPGCTWKPGQMPTRTSNITHPGVCEPPNSPVCKAKNGAWNLCVSPNFQCNATEEPDVTNITLRFSRTKIPSKVTNYYCQAFALPNDTDYHMIANEPLIDNAEVMHHSLVFGCDEKPEDRLFTEPRECGMGGNCQQLVALWGLGALGECLPKQYGIKIGKTGYKYFVIQYHWNNPSMRSDLYDASAFRFYLTTKLRPNNGAIMTMGQRYLELPPGQSMFSQNATCSSECTKKKLSQTVYFADIAAHMHYAGTHAEITHYRDGKKLRDLMPYSKIRYDEPRKLEFKTPIEFKPGDAIKMKCYFNTATNKDVVYYGESTQDEMCYLFISYYPSVRFKYCTNYGPIDECTFSVLKPYENCTVNIFLGWYLPKKWQPLLTEFCDFSIDSCRAGCMKVLKQMLREEPCWQGWAKKYLDMLSTFSSSYFYPLREARLRLGPCQSKLELTAATPIPPSSQPQPTKGPPGKDNMQQTQSILIGVGAGTVGLLVIVITAIAILKAMRASSPAANPGLAYIVNQQEPPPTFQEKEHGGAANIAYNSSPGES